jgi:Neuraminidase (sialidase)
MTQAPTILEHATICKQPGRYIGWPTIDKGPDGTLYAVFSGDRDAHVCPFGKTLMVRSEDGGQTWSEPVLITDSPLDDRDAGLCACAGGTLVVSWFTAYSDLRYLPDDAEEAVRQRWETRLRAISAADLAAWTHVSYDVPRGHWLRRSLDGGRTWEDPIRAPGTTPHGPIQLSDGRLFFLGNTGHDGLYRTTVIAASISEDEGQTWEVVGTIPMFPKVETLDSEGYAYLVEPHVVEVSPGHLLGMARYEVRPRVEGRATSLLWQFTSEDGGATWTDPKPTKILGKPPHLLKLKDGRLLVTYGYRHPPFGQRACVSEDGGATWGSEIILRANAPNGDLGYPATIQLDDGTLLTVYYQIEPPDETTSLMLTRWRL